MIRAGSPREMFDLARFLTLQPIPRGRRVGVASGGPSPREWAETDPGSFPDFLDQDSRRPTPRATLRLAVDEGLPPVIPSR